MEMVGTTVNINNDKQRSMFGFQRESRAGRQSFHRGPIVDLPRETRPRHRFITLSKTRAISPVQDLSTAHGSET